ncbi:MAG: aminotransferase class I/II-fold pyridoxal phosphate-dependent enzyme [Prevotella sp.]|nr:aminotransferase class I/II-fold pyridoxal phosphate-dependent enzyme [Prevotella sp.]
MISFECDYNNGAHPDVLRHLVETNSEQTLTYGFDRYSDSAREKIAAACGVKADGVHLLTGGTQTNATVIDAMLRSYEAVICPATGHINVHEAGAIEASGHKVIGLPHQGGKLEAQTLDRFMNVFENDESRDHVAQPGMVYVSLPTEMGTLYTADELKELYETCQRHQLQLFVDGARLGYALAAKGSTVTLPFLARHSDAFYIGGTKVGALCGEAVVFTHDNSPRCFFTIVKRHGALLAKGRLTGVQFDALFTNQLYMRISRHAIDMAERLQKILVEARLRMFVDSPTNQQFVVLPNALMHRLEQQVLFTHWEPFDDDHTVCRFVTSWATTVEELEKLKEILRDATT